MGRRFLFGTATNEAASFYRNFASPTHTHTLGNNCSGLRDDTMGAFIGEVVLPEDLMKVPGVGMST